MMKSKIHRLVVAGLFAAIGLMLPAFTAHAFGIPGTVLLPMHLPVLLCGLLCGPQLGAVCGLVVPVLSSLLTGMPATYPMLPIMAVQLVAMGLVGGLLYQRLRWHIVPSLVLSMMAGWALYGLMFAALMFFGNGELRALSVTAALLQGLPGLAVQLVLVPIIVSACKRFIFRDFRQRPAPEVKEDEKMLQKALGLIEEGAISCVVIQNDTIIHTADGRGVSPLLRLYENEPEKLKGALVVDKIIGKAAAMILALGGASAVYGVIMSVAAREYLEGRGLAAQYGRCVDVISNRDQTGICPIERSVLETEDPGEGLVKMKETIKKLMERAV